ncbi:fatty acid desaturase [[Leptolyngbya] sp. PCC 7376]|uniref:fatty acid desaturase family protein n=1 Tax=[Leptolyngbya] sp. PCC 7376 TaxID=111781 RepID=UPI00029F312C|nr:fatty acid desaturase [[Leptolyngbya] sp. PCC 7376]AFY37553.1 fatty acid desaturase [[Leptolyngbya] sp. PCC 7376]
MKTTVRQPYTELQSLLRKGGYFESRNSFYVARFLFLITLLVAHIACLVFVDNFPLQICNAIALAFTSTQVGLFAHDIVHRQAWRNEIFDVIVGDLLVGISCSWWHNKHNQKHHAHTNRLGLDTDIEAPFLALAAEQLEDKKGFEKFLIRFQAYYFLVVLFFIPVAMHIESALFLLKNKVKNRGLEAIAFSLHFGIYLTCLVLSPLNLWQAVIFTLIFKSLFGVYLGLIFIVNHAGMPIFSADEKIDPFSLQVLTSRNISAHPITDFLMGGLNAQIEHHLFPQMCRIKLNASRRLVRKFCLEKNIPYHETGFIRACVETFSSLNNIGKLSASQ